MTIMVTEHGIVFTGQEAPGAVSNGCRIVKVNSEPADGHPDGSLGTVAGSIAVPDEMRANMPPHLRDVEFVYFIKWDSYPELPVFVIGRKIARAN
jgi:hypothetical protein